MTHNYIICMYDDHYEVVGPFPNTATLVAYGERWQEDNDDRPTWQSIRLDGPRVMPTVITPQDNKRTELQRLVSEAVEEGACNWDSYTTPDRDRAKTEYTDLIWKLFN